MPENVSTGTALFGPDERRQLRDALRRPRGRYRTERAAQLSGIPARTLYHWAQHGVLSPDFPGRPVEWSYRDLVYARLLAWLRTRSMPRDEAAARVGQIRAFMEGYEDTPTELRSDGVGLTFGDEPVDRLTGQAILDNMAGYAASFDLLVPIDLSELRRGRRLWGPNLAHPSTRTAISPAVMAGDPCVRGTRIPTATLYALTTERELTVQDITRLYPGLDPADVEDAIALEHRLRAA